MNKCAKQYLQQVNKQIRCPSSVKRSFYRQLRNEVLSFCDNHEDVSLDLLKESFGSPEEVSEEFFSELGGLTANRYLHTHRKLLYTTIGIVLGAVLLIIIIDQQTNFLKEGLLKKNTVASIIYEEDSDQKEFRLPSWYKIFGEEDTGTSTSKE